MFPNATTFELSWTGLAIVGVVIFAVVIRLTWGDREHIQQPGADRRSIESRQVIVMRNLAIAGLCGGAELSLGIGGAIAMMLPNANRRLTTTGAIILGSLSTMHLFLFGIGLVLLVARRQLLARIEIERERAEAAEMGAEVEHNG